MNNLRDSYILSNGVKIPCFGFKTWQIPNGELFYKDIKYGYRHIDTSDCYENEESVDKVIKLSRVNIDDLFIRSNLWNIH